MNKLQAIKLRDKSRVTLIKQPFYRNEPAWIIRDVIVGNMLNITSIYAKMWNNKISNEEALKFFSINKSHYDVFVISHQWNYGSGDLQFENLTSYKAHSS